MKVRNLVVLVMAAVMVLGTAACGSEPAAQIANPWVDCSSLAEAGKTQALRWKPRSLSKATE